MLTIRYWIYFESHRWNSFSSIEVGTANSVHTIENSAVLTEYDWMLEFGVFDFFVVLEHFIDRWLVLRIEPNIFIETIKR